MEFGLGLVRSDPLRRVSSSPLFSVFNILAALTAGEGETFLFLLGFASRELAWVRRENGDGISGDEFGAVQVSSATPPPSIDGHRCRRLMGSCRHRHRPLAYSGQETPLPFLVVIFFSNICYCYSKICSKFEFLASYTLSIFLGFPLLQFLICLISSRLWLHGHRRFHVYDHSGYVFLSWLPLIILFVSSIRCF